MKKIFLLQFCLLVLLISMPTFAQESLKMNPALGLYGGLNFNMHSPSFLYDPNNYHVPFDEKENSLGLNIGIIGNIPLSEIFVLSGRIGYNQMDGKLQKTYAQLDFYTTNNTIDAKISYLEIAPIMQFHNLLPMKNLYFLAGLELGLPITKKYDLTIERSPNLFTTPEADIPDASARFAAVVGAGWVFELDKHWKLSPEVSFRIPFTKVSTNANFDKWNIPQLRAGINITYDFFSDDQPEEKPITPRETYLDASFGQVNAVNKDGSKASVKVVRVEDMQYTELFPLLPYVFYDEMEEQPIETIQVMSSGNEAGKFNFSLLESDAEKINIRTLDIIGTRMQANPKSTITITGTNDGKKEKSVKGLSLNRANFAKEYLINNFGIASDRIIVKAVNTPEKASSSKDPDGIAENRRIEITGDEPKLFEPIIISGENQRVAAPDLIEFIPDIKTSDSITYWKLDVTQSGNNLKSLHGTSQPKAIHWAISPNVLANKQLPVDYVLILKNSAGKEKKIKGTIPVEYFSTSKKKSEELPDKTISKYSLVLFDFDKADVSKADMEIVDKYIVPAVKFNSTIDIYGYTDRIGDDTYNQQLAERRANAVKKILEAKVPNAKFVVHGIGESVSIFDNENPVGRQLSRTVQIYVTTPKK